MKCDKCGDSKQPLHYMFAQGWVFDLCAPCYNLYNRMNDYFTMKHFIGPGKETEEEASVRLYELGKDQSPHLDWENDPVFDME